MVRAGQTLQKASHPISERRRTSEGKRLSQEAWLGLASSVFDITNPILWPSFLAFFTFISPLLVPSFLIGRVGCGPVPVSVLSQLLILDQRGDVAALFSALPISGGRLCHWWRPRKMVPPSQQIHQTKLFQFSLSNVNVSPLLCTSLGVSAGSMDLRVINPQ